MSNGCWRTPKDLRGRGLAHPPAVDDVLVLACHTRGPLAGLLVQAVFLCAPRLSLQLPALKHAEDLHHYDIKHISHTSQS